MRRRAWPIVIAFSAALVVAGCSGGGGSQGSEVSTAEPKTAMAAPTTPQVGIQGFGFKPSALDVRPGTRVLWTQQDNTTHTVTSGSVGAIDPTTGQAKAQADGKFSSGDLRQGARFEFTFAAPGIYSYFCQYHPEGMRGQITVGG